LCRRCGLAIAAERTVLTLRQIAPTDTNTTWNVIDSPQQIGRIDSSIRLPDRTVSRRHARIAPGPRGFVLEDLGSSAGTYVNDIQITEPTLVHNGDRLAFGDVVLVAEVPEPAAVEARPPARPQLPAAPLTVDYAWHSVSSTHTGPPVDATVSELQPAATPSSELLEQFEENGGTAVLQSLIAQLRTTDAGNARTLGDRLPRIRKFLEIELTMIEHIRSCTSRTA
jgi:pSer/pThr/pTyr-binding forkhead associated (FHA) protein